MPFIPEHIATLQPYKAGKSIEEIKKAYHLDTVVKLASNENPLGPSPKALEAIKASLDSIHRYPQPGFDRLREALARRFGVYEENVIAGHGSESILSVIMRTFLSENDEVITSAGTFIGFRVLANIQALKLITVPLDAFRFDLGAIAERATTNTKLIYIANPNNPTGTMVSEREFLTFHQRIPDHVLIVMDEAYFDFAGAFPDYPDSMKYRFDNVITLRTFSKAYGLAGIRIGYGFASPELIGAMMKVKLPFEPGIPSQAAGLAALEDEAFLQQYLELNRRGLRFLYNLFDSLSVTYIRSCANFVTIVLESADAADALNTRLLEQGVIVRPLASFGLPHCIRITAGREEENQYFARALEKALKSKPLP